VLTRWITIIFFNGFNHGLLHLWQEGISRKVV
jgi:hypothetical protein